MTVPTKKQYELLRILGNGCIALAPGYREWQALVNRGWVRPAWTDDLGVTTRGRLKFWPPLRITVDGLHALAAAVDRYGWPEDKRKADR